jgi:AcrR family transcriptional regulator
MAEPRPKRAANRPSRRADLISTAVELFALQPWEFVTVTDIVQRAGMTPAAFYYHFSSREQVLEEIVEGFATEWIDMIERLLSEAQTPEALNAVAAGIVDGIEASEERAKIFFVSAATAPVVVQRIHRDARNRLIRATVKAIRRLVPDRSKVDASVNAVALVVLYETAARARLSLDEPYRTLGPRRFRNELTKLSRVAAGFDTP